MTATKTRVACPHCGRSIAQRKDTGGICGHGPHHRRCPGSSLTPVSGPLTDRQVEFARYCFRVGDGLPVDRMFGIEYPQPDLAGVELDDVLCHMTEWARQWIVYVVQSHAKEYGQSLTHEGNNQ